jgi:hypothetical protein
MNRPGHAGHAPEHHQFDLPRIRRIDRRRAGRLKLDLADQVPLTLKRDGAGDGMRPSTTS